MDPCGTPLSIEWSREHVRTDTVRVRAHTCACRSVFFELCQAGGLRFIRRTTVGGTKVLRDESPRDLAEKVDELWRLLLSGRAC